MSDRPFLDTNVLVYCYSADDYLKRETAMDILNSFSDALTSVHILNEFSNVCIKKAGATPQDVSKMVYEIVEYVNCVRTDPSTVHAALAIKQAFKLSYYDSFHIATAQQHGSRTFFSEDMQDGMVVKGVRIVNPFKENKSCSE
ncbi:MAG: PIN domain-containing protein [Smithella sp.]|nr:PIN domain-containing protein [Smithella sp.]MDD5673090.1 PIN domain-containing protein [Chitinivibrionales bacterium]